MKMGENGWNREMVYEKRKRKQSRAQNSLPQSQGNYWVNEGLPLPASIFLFSSWFGWVG